MRKFLIQLGVVAVGLVMVAWSAVSVGRLQSYSDNTSMGMIKLGEATESGGVNQKYQSQEIMPDEVGYKAIMIWDRVKLLTCFNKEAKVKLMMEFAKERLERAKGLVEEDKKKMAAETVLKAQGYLEQAAVLAAEVNDGELVSELTEMAKEHKASLEVILKEVDGEAAEMMSQAKVRNAGVMAAVAIEETKVETNEASVSAQTKEYLPLEIK